MTGVAIVIPMLNEAAELPRLLRSLAALEPPPAEVLAVDGGSADASIRHRGGGRAGCRPARYPCCNGRARLWSWASGPNRRRNPDGHRWDFKVRFALDSPLEESGFELLVPPVDAGVFGRNGTK